MSNEYILMTQRLYDKRKLFFCTWYFPTCLSLQRTHLFQSFELIVLNQYFYLTSDDFQFAGRQRRFGQGVFLLFGCHSGDTAVLEGFCTPDHYSQVLCELGVSLGPLQLVPLLLLHPYPSTEVYLEIGQEWNRTVNTTFQYVHLHHLLQVELLCKHCLCQRKWLVQCSVDMKKFS